MEISDKQTALAELARTWDLEQPGGLTEEAILAALADRVARLLEREPEAFFQLMYRLDISEKSLHQALATANPPAAVSRLIWERQWQKALHRHRHPGHPPEDPDLKW